MSERPARARLFVALDLPAPAREGLAAWAAEATRGHEGLRLLDAEMLHVTLCFLGWREERETEAFSGAVLGCSGPAPSLAVGAPAWLPPRRPGVLAVDLEDRDGMLGALQASVTHALKGAVGYEPERRPFRPHVTVARVRGRGGLRPFELEPPRLPPFSGTALTLYRSFTEPGGARYEPLARVAL